MVPSSDQWCVLTGDTTCPIRKSKINNRRRHNGSNTRVRHQPALIHATGPKLMTSTKTTCIVQRFHKKDLFWHFITTSISHKRPPLTQLLQYECLTSTTSTASNGPIRGSEINDQCRQNWCNVWVWHKQPALTQLIQDAGLSLSARDDTSTTRWSHINYQLWNNRSDTLVPHQRPVLI